MFKLTAKQQKIISIFLKNESLSSSQVHAEMARAGEDVSLVTIKRMLSEMAGLGALEVSGSGRSTVYAVGAPGRIFAEVGVKEYVAIEPDRRRGLAGYNFELLSALPPDIFSDDEFGVLERATAIYRQRTKDLPETIRKKELERLVIELSWKSSKIEGNTYTLLDTEKLITENKAAAGKTREETQMILNHKDAFYYIRDNTEKFKTVTRGNLEELHTILVKDLGVGLGLRKKPVGVTGSLYRPLDNIHQITDAIDVLAASAARMSTPYAKALIGLVGLAYIQPFEDGNKRTSRLAANAVLLAHGLAPLSYRSIDEDDYREAMLVFYELNAIGPIKKIFIGQYDFAAKNYAVK